MLRSFWINVCDADPVDDARRLDARSAGTDTVALSLHYRL